jgi:hypothetical protein
VCDILVEFLMFVQLLLDALFVKSLFPSRLLSAAVKKITCSPENFVCCAGTCPSCKDKLAIDGSLVNVVIITYYQWKKVEENGKCFTKCVEVTYSTFKIIN